MSQQQTGRLHFFLGLGILWHGTQALLIGKNMNDITPKTAHAQTILVTGGAGYIGSHTAYLLHRAGHNVIILDNFSHQQPWPHTWATVIRGDFADTTLLDRIFTEYPIESVMHFAASIQVGESVEKPDLYWNNNVTKTLTLLNRMHAHNVKHFIFSSTCAVYGKPQTDTVNENHPTTPVSPYGDTKLAIERALHNYADAGKIAYVSLRYFNVSGACPEFGLGAPITHVTDIILDCQKRNVPFSIFGNDYNTIDGTGIRDYVHVRDIARGHIKAMKYLHKKTAQINETHAYVFNLGTGSGYSVGQLVTAAEAATNEKIKTIIAPRRPGDMGKIAADATRAQQELGWIPKYSSLEHIFKTTIDSQTRKLGYSLQNHQSEGHL